MSAPRPGGPGVAAGMLSIDDLRKETEAGTIDTVVAAFTDMQGRLFGKRIQVADWETLNDLLGDATLFVNTTTLGMAGQPELAADVGRLPSHAIVADLVYVPLVTPLVRAAKKRGLRTADGLGMLLHQAVGGFSLWFGQKPEVTAELRALAEADLGASAG